MTTPPAPYLHRTCTVPAPSLHRICTVPAPYLHRTCTVPAPDLHRTCTGLLPSRFVQSRPLPSSPAVTPRGQFAPRTAGGTCCVAATLRLQDWNELPSLALRAPPMAWLL